MILVGHIIQIGYTAILLWIGASVASHYRRTRPTLSACSRAEARRGPRTSSAPVDARPAHRQEVAS
ncbi:hypothetical protein IU501_10810 [Nocardia otitidiscaviarum]|uniref:hypothetical protein n=1 Tax=Nocardia otitidiscaviarum TaxID=1823 RepID=UPI001895B3F7|nr:hypothetical protein [Nocardia otitidiscaviarum]MBF6133489.1 hypothetical protein [Nocardia otitidiscaviarum]